MAAEAIVSESLTHTFLISPEDMFADGLVSMLRASRDIDVVACQDFDDSCLGKLKQSSIDLLFINAKSLQYPLEAFFKQFTDARRGLRIIVFGHDDSQPYVRNLIRSGASGFINDEIRHDELGDCIREVMAGHLWVERSLLDQIAIDAFEFEKMIEQSIMERIDAMNEELTAREADIFRLVLEGLSTREIADNLHLSQQSVKLYLNRLFKKYEVSNRSQLILIAFEKVCPIQNMVKLFRKTLDRKRLDEGKEGVIPDPLTE
jgi:DNA-binding NarL/FixJ family response regulator